MNTPIGGNRRSHQKTRQMMERLRAKRREINNRLGKCPVCGHFKGSTLCRCKVKQVLAEAETDRNMKLLMGPGIGARPEVGEVVKTQEGET